MSDALLLRLEAVLEEGGWDRPARFITIQGSMVDPIFKPFAQVEGHPCEVLHGMWAEGVRVPSGTLGIALVVEGDRHLKIAEVKDRAPAMYASMVEAAGGGEPEEIQTAIESAWLRTCSNTPPSSFPEALKVRVRNSVAVLNTGWMVMVIRDHGGEPEVLDPVPPARLKDSRVPDFMHLFLTGQEPVD